MTPELISQLKRHEGLGKVVGQRTYVYRCTAGALTVGYGHNLDANPLTAAEREITGWNGSSITLKGAELLLQADAELVERQVLTRLPWASKLSPVRLGVLVNMAFQMGVGGLLKFKITLGLIRAGQYRAASAAMLRSAWARQTPSRGRELAAQMRAGTYRFN